MLHVFDDLWYLSGHIWCVNDDIMEVVGVYVADNHSQFKSMSYCMEFSAITCVVQMQLLVSVYRQDQDVLVIFW